MPKRKRFDEKSTKNRIRVQAHRLRKKIQLIHNTKVHQRIEAISEHQMGFANSLFMNENHNDSSKNTAEKSPEKDFNAAEFKTKLRLWATNYNISGEAINGLLAILIWAGFSFLPKDSRTLKKTPPKVPIDILTNGKLFYYGVGKCLENVSTAVHEHIDFITLNFNFDGFPISKSSSSQFWPILASIKGNYIYINHLYRNHVYISAIPRHTGMFSEL